MATPGGMTQAFFRRMSTHLNDAWHRLFSALYIGHCLQANALVVKFHATGPTSTNRPNHSTTELLLERTGR